MGRLGLSFIFKQRAHRDADSLSLSDELNLLVWQRTWTNYFEDVYCHHYTFETYKVRSKECNNRILAYVKDAVGDEVETLSKYHSTYFSLWQMM